VRAVPALILLVAGCADEPARQPYEDWPGVYEGPMISTVVAVGDTAAVIDTVTQQITIGAGSIEGTITVLDATIQPRADGGYEGNHTLAVFGTFSLAFFSADSLRIAYLADEDTVMRAVRFRGRKLN
jgi:hypothetical protein